MKFSVNLAQYFSNTGFKSIPHDELVERLGLQLGAIESTKDYVPYYDGVVVVKVVECEKHPNADKLSLCRIDDGGVTEAVERGEDGLIQVVCGAPNVRAGICAAWIPPGATVPSTRDSDPFVLEARELRGKVSNGMLASPKELDLFDSHDGILEIDPEEVGREPQAGEPITAYFGLDDFVIDCENKMFTHRPDCFGNLGIAREVAGIFGQKFEDPAWYWNTPQFGDVSTIELDVQNDIPDLVPRFVAVVMENVQVGPSPVWLRALLKRVGIKSINNVVDVTNFVMHLTGQPTHAFDYDKVVRESKTSDGAQLQFGPRMAGEGEKVNLLNGKTATLTKDDMVIASGNTALAVAGVMGGADTEVDDQTRRILIECATFNMYTVRKTSMRHGLFTDAVTRFNKGQSPLQNDRVLAYLMEQMTQYAGATQASSVYDIRSDIEDAYDVQSLGGQLVVSTEFINSRLSTDLSSDDICALLQNVHFEASKTAEEELAITAPFWRMDIEIAEDIVEEVGRLYGYQNITATLPVRTTMPAPRNMLRDFSNTCRTKLYSAGGNEVLSYSFIHGDLLAAAGINPDQWTYHLRNAISPELQYYRPALIPSLLAKVRQNIKANAGRDDNAFLLFELGRAHVRGYAEDAEPELPKQMRHIAGVFAADGKAATLIHGAPYYQAKRYVDMLTNNQATYVPVEDMQFPIAASFRPERCATVLLGGSPVGIVGEFHATLHKKLKLPHFCAGFELDIEALQQLQQPKKYRPLSLFPTSTQDITIEVQPSISWQRAVDVLRAELEVVGVEYGYTWEVRPLDIFQTAVDSVRRLSFRVEIGHPERTLQTNDVSAVLQRLETVVSSDLQAVRI